MMFYRADRTFAERHHLTLPFKVYQKVTCSSTGCCVLLLAVAPAEPSPRNPPHLSEEDLGPTGAEAHFVDAVADCWLCLFTDYFAAPSEWRFRVLVFFPKFSKESVTACGVTHVSRLASSASSGPMERWTLFLATMRDCGGGQCS